MIIKNHANASFRVSRLINDTKSALSSLESKRSKIEGDLSRLEGKFNTSEHHVAFSTYLWTKFNDKVSETYLEYLAVFTKDILIFNKDLGIPESITKASDDLLEAVSNLETMDSVLLDEYLGNLIIIKDSLSTLEKWIWKSAGEVLKW